MTAADPFHLTTRLVEAFRRDGGVVLRETLRDIETGPDRRVTLLTDAGTHAVDRLVLATGAWSRRWAAKLGARIPMDTERGYHVMLSDPGFDLRIPVLSGDHRFGVTPMAGGIRVAGTAELAGLDAPPNYRRAEMLVPMAEALLPGLRTNSHETGWDIAPRPRTAFPSSGGHRSFPRRSSHSATAIWG